MKALPLLLLLLLLLPMQSMAQYEIEAQIDKPEVAFGESLNLVISITHYIGNGGVARSMTPEINEIPGFDIASSRTGHSTSFINGQGVTRSQVVLELVPREPGQKEIPAFSFSGPDGQIYSSKPISVKVLPPEDQKPEEPAPTEKAAPAGNSLFRYLMAGGIVMIIVFSIPFLLSYIASISGKAAHDSGAIEDAEIVGFADESRSTPVESAPKPRIRINFPQALAALKRKSPEADAEFYREFFDIFRQAAVGSSGSLREDMTPDEMMMRIRELSPSETTRQATIRLANDLEMVMYAGKCPARSCAAIEEDARTVLAVID
ncbi:MAG: BatD family protein [Candidatus Rifleibacteriota bacterium]